MLKKVQDKAALLELLEKNSEQIHGFGIKSLGLFGSFVRDEEINEKSDVDFLTEFESGKATFRNLMDLGYFLEDLTGRKVELIARESLSKFIGPHILKQVQNVSLSRSRVSPTYRRGPQ